LLPLLFLFSALFLFDHCALSLNLCLGFLLALSSKFILEKLVMGF